MEKISVFNLYLEEANLEKKPHQQEAVVWCLDKEKNGVKCNETQVYGGLIADEMGLGKTIQMIGTMVANPKQTLIILPRALLEQWKNFIITTTHSKFKLHIFHGLHKIKTVEELKQYDIVITTYGMIKPKSLLYEIKWERLVFDEAHHFRNQNTNAFKGAYQLNGKIRWLLTGTPIQNSKKDFYSLCAQLNIPKDFYLDPHQLYYIAKNLILKRTKSQVNINLPPLTIEEIPVQWESIEEQQLTEEIHSGLSFSNITYPEFNIGQAFGETSLPLLIRAKQMCIYPPLLKDKVQSILQNNPQPEKIEKLLLKSTENSSKIKNVANKIIQQKDNDKKKLIFCHYRGEIDALKDHLEQAKLRVETFDGRTKAEDRERILSSQNLDALILQIQTGCEGLNLQYFSEIYFVSPHWNPAVEDQAIARAHRIGQTKETTVFRFVMTAFNEKEETYNIDQYSSHVQEEKRELRKFIEPASPASPASPAA